MLRRRAPGPDLEPVDVAPSVPDPEPAGEAAARRRPIVPRPPARAVAVVVVLAVAAAALWAVRRPPERPPLDRAEAQRIADRSAEAAVNQLRAAPARSAELYDAIAPSLVVVRKPGAAPVGSDPTGLGTGVVISDEGTILTALHVVEGAAAVELTFADGTRTRGRIESADRNNDIAVITPERLPEVVVPAVLGGGVDVGDEVVAVGHPLGLVASLSAGVVSGLDRSAPVEGGRTLRGLIQFDAAVNPGNSGGPLLNRDGRVVGIVAALANPTDEGYFIGIGFAVPIATAGGAAGAPAR